MDDEDRTYADTVVANSDGLTRFVDSYASFTRIINSLQRKYIELQEEFSDQNHQLFEANEKLVELTEHNLAATGFMDSILDSIAVGVVAVDAQGCITRFNPAASRMLGIPQREPLGRRYREIMPVPADDLACAAATLESGRDVSEVEKQLHLRDGSTARVSVSTSVLHDEGGRISGAVEVIHDLTKMKKMEQELARLNTLAAMGEMAATIAHEVRNPLAGIAGFAALLERDMAADDARRKLVRKIARGVESLNETVTTLLNYSRNEEAEVSEVDYGGFLKETLDDFCREYGERVSRDQLQLRTPPPTAQQCPAVALDTRLFRQVFFNVFNNALEAMEEAVSITVDYRVLPRQSAVERYGETLLLGSDETVVETVITDSGPGIDDEHLERIFAPFFTTKPEGTGLGLAVVWKIVKAHGGEILVENSAESGACFRILLPIRFESINAEH
ncbi:PAS domain-containing protein [candidate division GN15 bacterium]|nr:PAS domain-containing protein [candidate division GN15 bacterium]